MPNTIERLEKFEINYYSDSERLDNLSIMQKKILQKLGRKKIKIDKNG